MHTRFVRVVTKLAAFAFTAAAFAQSTPPHAISFIKPANGIYHAASPLGFLIKFGGNVTFTGAPRLSLQVGGHMGYAVATWAEGDRLYFIYRVEDGASANGLSLASNIDLNGGTISVGGAAADTSLNWPELSAAGTFDLSGIRVDTTYPPVEAPTIAPQTATGAWRYASHFAYLPVVTGRQATFSATNLPIGLTLYPESGLIGQTSDTVSPLKATGTVTVANSVGSASAQITFVMTDLIYDWLPASNDVRSVGTPPDGTYHAGDTLTFSLTYPYPVVVFGRPQLELYVGGRSRFAQYVPTDSASDVVFRYTVMADDQDSDGVGVARMFDRTNADVRSAIDGVRLENGWGIIPDTREIFVSAIAGTPRPVSIVRPAPGTYRPGNVIAVGVRFNANGVTFTGRPRLALHFGSATRYAEAFGSLGDVLGFAYTVDAGDGTASGLTIDSAIDLNGGSLSIDHNVASPSLEAVDPAALTFSGVSIDTAPPSGNTTIYSAAATGPGTSGYEFYYDPIVSGPPPTAFSASNLPSSLSLKPSTGSIMQTGSVTVPAGGTFTLTANGPSAPSAAMTARLVSVNTSALPDPYSPTSVGVPADGTYFAGTTMYFSVTYSAAAPLKVIGTPQLDFTIGGQTRTATYLPGFRGDQLVFAYTVAAGDAGVVSLPGRLSGDYFACTYGGMPNYSGWPFTVDTSHVTVNGSTTGPQPIPTITYPEDTLETWWQSYDLRDNAPHFLVHGTDSPTTYGATGLPPNVHITSYGLVEPNPAAPGIYDVTFSATNAAGTGTKRVRWIVYPAATGASPYFGTYHEGDTIPFAVGFSGPVVVTGVPTLALSNGMQLRYVGGSGTNVLSFAVVATPEFFNADAGILPIELKLNGGTIQSPDGLTAKIALRVQQKVGEPIPGVKIITHPRFTSVLSDSATAGASYSYQLKAENWVTTYDATNLPDGLTFAFDQTSYTGVISGSPRAAGTYNILLKAWNQFYADPATATLTLTVNAASTPPPSPPSSPSSQTIAFAPVGAPMVGQSITIAAAASSGLPVTLTLISGNATLIGTTLTINDSSPVTVRAAQGGGNGYAPTTADLVVTAGKLTQQITFATSATALPVGQSLQLQATSSAGLPISFSVVSGPGLMAGDTVTVNGVGPIVVRAAQSGNDAYAAASADLNLTGMRAGQHIDFSSPVSAINIGQPIRLGALSSSGLPVTYTVVSGPAMISGDLLTITGPGPVVIRATQAGTETVAAASAEITVTGTAVPTSRLVNLSSRARVSAGDDARAFIAGFVVTGTAPKRLLLRAVGPTLANYQVSGVLADPRFRLFDTSGHVVAENDNWTDAEASAAAAHAGAFPLANGTHDAALAVTLPPGDYSIHITSNGGDGVALAEVYDASDTPTTDTQKLINISTRAYVDTGENVLVAGFVVSGDSPKRVLIRGIGPGLSAYGVSTPLSDPIVTLYRENRVVARNDNWETGIATTAGDPAATAVQIAAAASATGAFPLQSGSKDASLVLTLSPGLYSAIVSGANGATGNGMVEIYELPSP